MTKEEHLKKLILNRRTLKDFAAEINMPYGTLYSILKNVDGASMYNIMKICKGLHISADGLSQIDKGQTDCFLAEAPNAYSHAERTDLKEILRNSPIRFDGEEYMLPEEERNILIRIIGAVLEGRKE